MILRAALHYSLWALDPWYTNYAAGQEVRDGPSSLYNRPWRFQGSNSLNGWSIYTTSYIASSRYNLLVLSFIALGPPTRGGSNAEWRIVANNRIVMVVTKLEHLLWSLDMIHFHFTLTLRVYRAQFWISIYTVQPSDDFPKTLRFSWSWLLVCV